MITAQVKTPMSKDDPTDMKVEVIPLPPPELWGELNNAPAAPAAAPAAAPEEEAKVERPEQVLQFSIETREKIVPLLFPFLLDGAEVERVRVRRLTLGDVDRVFASADFTLFDIYGMMTGLSPAVLRGMDDDDAVAVTGACYDFLPRRLKVVPASGETSAGGEATSPTSRPTSTTDQR
ncbi:phage tail assembly protein [Neorhizobium galegae]|uniref:Phage tail assembly protein n=1 Tax=Neorhizobium galegae TaxID=399 RepID=A0A6A1TS96_NEOGA|nr:phage tail assembly protein [Neorhizobium galegae]KAB1087359.1 phage tail assembly protein [Neorhizobium galegae]